MGDEDMVKEWAARHPSPNCAEAGWELLAAVSEFDYIFVCVDATSEHFGATRRVVNNCDEDMVCTPAPFSKFVERLDAFADKWLEVHGGMLDQEADEEEELPSFVYFDPCEREPMVPRRW